MKHTPGPWRVARFKSKTLFENPYHIEHTKTKEILAKMGENKLMYKNCEANARLIASAPELLEALKDATRELQYHAKDDTGFPRQTVLEIIKDAEKAIEKVEGK